MEISRNIIKRLFLFEYEYWKVKSLDEVRRRVSKEFQFLPVENLVKILEEMVGSIESLVKYSPEKALAIRSARVYPPTIYFLIVEENEIGGKIFLIETAHSPYSYEKILTGMRAFSAYVGIKCQLIKQL